MISIARLWPSKTQKIRFLSKARLAVPITAPLGVLRRFGIHVLAKEPKGMIQIRIFKCLGTSLGGLSTPGIPRKDGAYRQLTSRPGLGTGRCAVLFIARTG